VRAVTSTPSATTGARLLPAVPSAQARNQDPASLHNAATALPPRSTAPPRQAQLAIAPVTSGGCNAAVPFVSEGCNVATPFVSKEIDPQQLHHSLRPPPTRRAQHHRPRPTPPRAELAE
jgi:hypothetical protein